jgi:hypothetical protein
VSRKPLPPVATVVSFIDCINRGDLEGLIALMAPGHVLKVLDEPPLRSVEALREGWRAYFEAFPNYVVYPRLIVDQGETVAFLGSTTGSHLGLPDDEERRIDVLWIAEVRGGLVVTWSIVKDAPEMRRRLGLAPA